MSFQDSNFSMGDAPTSTARLLQSIIQPSSTNPQGASSRPLGAEQAISMIRALLIPSLDIFFEIHKWTTPAQFKREKEMSETTHQVIEYALTGEVARIPKLWIQRFPEYKDVEDLYSRARATGPHPQTLDQNGSQVDLQEELSMWLIVRLIYATAVIRDASTSQLPLDQREVRIKFIRRLEAAAKSIHTFVFCSADREMRTVKPFRANDFAKLWTTINEEIRAMIMGWVEGTSPEGSDGHLGCIELLGADRRTQIPLSEGRVNCLQLDQRPFTIPIFSRSVATNILLTSLRIHFSIIHHSIYLLDTIPSAVEALVSLWEYTMGAFPMGHNQHALEDLIEMLGWFVQEPAGPQQLLSVTKPGEDPYYLASYIKSKSSLSLDKICSAIIDQTGLLFATNLPTNQNDPVHQSHSFILLLLKIMRWLADENGRTAMSKTSRSIHRIVVKYGKLMIAELLSNSETALNVSNPDIKMISLSLLCCPIDSHLGRPRYSHISQETYATYELLDPASANQFESLLSNFAPRWTQQIMAQRYCMNLRRLLHWLSQSIQAIYTRLALSKKDSPVRKRKRGDPEEVNNSEPSKLASHQVGAIVNSRTSRAENNQADIHADETPHSTTLHSRIGSLLKSCSSVPEVSEDIGQNDLTSILLKTLERITTHILSSKEENSEVKIKIFQRVEREFDLLGSLICNSALEHDKSSDSSHYSDLSCLPRDELKSLFQCLSCDRCHLDAINTNLSELKVLPPRIFTSAIMLCHNSELLVHSRPTRSTMKRDDKLIESAKSGARLSLIRFLTRVINHTIIDDLNQIHESPIISTPEVNMCILTVLERGGRMERIAAGRMLASVISNSLHLFRIRRVGQLSDCQLEPVLAQLEVLAKDGSLKIQETLSITVILCFELTRITDVELMDHCLVELDRSLSYRICTILLRQMCIRNPYLFGVIKTEMTFLSRRIGVSTYTSLARYLPSLCQFLVVELKFDRHGSALLAELLGMSYEVFLIQTSRYTLPHLVLHSQEAMIREIARKNQESVPQLLISQAADIITHLCLQNTTEQLKKGAEAFYRILNSDRRNSAHEDQIGIELSAIIDLVPDTMYYRLIVEATTNEFDRSRGPENVKAALRKALLLKKSLSDWDRMPDDNEIQQELRSRTLPILSHIKKSLQDLKGKIMAEKIKVMHGLGDLICLIDSTVSSYIPQIMASLHASLTIPALRSATLQTFSIFVKVAPMKDLRPFVGQITATIHSIWPHMNAEQMNVSILMLQHILRQHPDLGHYLFDIADLSSLSAPTVPSAEYPRLHSNLVGIIQEQATFKKNLTWSAKLKNLIDRINSESEIVIRQSLKELSTLLESDPEKIKMLMAGDTFHPFIGNLVKALIGVTARCNDSSDDIKSLAFECLGTVGAVDPDRCEISEDKTEMVLASNFSDHEESVNFALHLLQDGLVGAYRSTDGSKHHNFVTYAIQELLKFCGFTPDLVDPRRINDVPNAVRKKWNSVPKQILDSITPLLGSKFKLSSTPDTPYNVPVYNNTTVYSSWLKNWLLRLIPLIENQEASDIFLPFVGVIGNGDTVISQKLIPHIALHIVISGAPEELENIKLEIVTVLEDQVDRRSGFSPEGRQLVAQTIFSLMDHFSRWIRDSQKAQTSMNETGAFKRKDSKYDPATIRVKSIMTQISQELIASAALYGKDHARALLNFEQQILKLEGGPIGSGNSLATNETNDEISPQDQLQNYYEKAHEIYAAIDEPDGMEGISAKITAPSILHQIREHESTGRWTSAQSCWEVELQRQPDELRSHLGLLRCLRNLGHYDSLRAHIVGVLQSHPDWEKELAPFSVESSLVSNNWEGLTRAVQVGSLESPEVIFGKVVDMLLNNDEQSFEEAMKDARIRLGNQILGASRKDAYKRMYDAAIYLHILHELPLIDQACCEASAGPRSSKIKRKVGSTIGQNLMNHLDFRLESISPAFRYQEQLLRLRRATFQLRSRGAPAVGQLWVQTAKIARKAGHLQTAYSAVLQASELKAPTAFIQQAKLMKLEDQPHKAVLKLDDNLKRKPFTSTADGSFDKLSELCSRDYAKASLQRVRWMDEVDRYPANHIVERFEKLCTENPSWASSYYYFGRFYDERASQATPGIRSSQNWVTAAEYTFHCCRNFQKSLTFGTKFIYQALPRLLTMYFTFGEHPNLLEVFKSVERKKRLTDIRHEDYTLALRSDELGLVFIRVDKVIHNAVKKLPVFEWLTVLPQVVSRVMHKSTHVQAIVHKILTHVLRSYPDQALWAMVSGVESSNSARSSRCSWVLQDATDVSNTSVTQLEPPVLLRKIERCRKLVKQLLKLCNFPIKGNTKHLSMNEVFPALQQCSPCDLIIPVQHSLIANLPPNDVNFANHQPFPSDLPMINGFADKILIMSSLQKPRRIVIFGTDGKEYPFLCKPKDDLRKDARLMEFNSMINKLLKKDSESRKRHLHIRTYAVVVLNEECGLLEWVPNTITFRNILVGLYNTKGITIWNAEIKALSDKIRKHRDDWDKVKQIFENEVLSKFPSVFHQWFLYNFPDPTSWLRSRQAYGRTCAVMSMVGFVLGLGDRHGENILFDSTTGDVVHVDFNCLFDKGRTFEVSENVPFRLTHNLVSGLGITGVEGVFRRASEVTMGILRNNKDSLMSVLETFVHDPLVDWMPSVSKRKGVDAPTEEYVAREAKKCLEPISRKLTGFQNTSALSGKTDRQTSTENQVDSLINEARDNRHLGRMYFGWAPFL